LILLAKVRLKIFPERVPTINTHPYSLGANFSQVILSWIWIPSFGFLGKG